MIKLSAPFLALSCAVALALVPTLCVTAETPAGGPTPYPAADDVSQWPGKGPIRVFGWMTDNRAHYWKSREKDQGAVVFVGDSLTQGWKNLGEALPDLKVANRGIGGDVTRGVLFRLKEDVLDLNPRAVVILIGANDLSAHGNTADIIQNLTDIVAQCREAFPEMPVVLCTIPPRESAKAPTKPGAIEAVNDGIKAMAGTDKNLAILDLNKLFSLPDGKADLENFAPDGLHLGGPGYVKWGEALKPVLADLGVK